jgi:serine/threonine protein phosphatase PrpC
MDNQLPFVRTGPLHDLVTVPASPSDRLPDDRRVVARVFALTDVGQLREHNEDTFLVADLEAGTSLDFTHGDHELIAEPHGLLFLVADGMGGAASGELASHMASTLVLEALHDSWKSTVPSAISFAEALRDATSLANARIHQYARDNPEHRGMGTTITIAGLLGDQLYMAQVGDSRAYMVRDTQVQLLTKDQSLMQRLVEAGELTAEEAEVSERRNVILQALGPEAQVTVDLTQQQVRLGDTLILCSDGLSGLVRAPEIASVVREEHDVRAMCDRLVHRANALGGYDNITVIAVQFSGNALQHTARGDTIGYNTLPLAGTLNDATSDAPVAGQEQHAPFKSDPTPRYGTPVPSRAVLEVEFAKVRTAEEHGRLAVSAPVAEQRRRAVQPIYALLALIGILASVWLVAELFFS